MIRCCCCCSCPCCWRSCNASSQDFPADCREVGTSITAPLHCVVHHFSLPKEKYCVGWEFKREAAFRQHTHSCNTARQGRGDSSSICYIVGIAGTAVYRFVSRRDRGDRQMARTSNDQTRGAISIARRAGPHEPTSLLSTYSSP